jgi:ubiquinone/menaquinone biosynthesis C-methylase UbiE
VSAAAARFFDAIAGRYDRVYGMPSEQSRARMQRALRELPPAARVLDLGVGTGRELSALLDAGHQPVGVDVSAPMLERCARRARPVTLVRADFWAPLPFEDASFDAVIALHGTLAHPPDDRALPELACELGRVVRPGGVWVTEVPSPAWLDVEPMDDRRLTRTGPATGVYEDVPTGATIEVRLRSDAEWVAALSPVWSVRVEASTPVEWLVVARRAR